MDYMIVNDEVYEQMKPLGQSFYMYNYKIKQPENFAASVKSLQANPHCHGLVKIDPNREDIKWIKYYIVFLSLCSWYLSLPAEAFCL